MRYCGSDCFCCLCRCLCCCHIAVAVVIATAIATAIAIAIVIAVVVAIATAIAIAIAIAVAFAVAFALLSVLLAVVAVVVRDTNSLDFLVEFPSFRSRSLCGLQNLHAGRAHAEHGRRTPLLEIDSEKGGGDGRHSR